MVAVEPVALRFVRPEWSHEVPSPPHDALSAEARRQHLIDHPRSYLGVTRSPEDVDHDTVDPAGEAMRLSRASLETLLAQNVFEPTRSPGLYLYRLEEPGHRQTGLICGVGSAAYDAGQVRIHERVKQPRADLLARHLDQVGAQSSPIAMAFQSSPEIESIIDRVTTTTDPFIDLLDGDLRQSIWSVPDPRDVDAVCAALAPEHLYLIDGHHRAAAASAHQRLAGTTGHLMLSVLFPFAELRNLAFHRIVAPVDGDRLLQDLGSRFATVPATPAEVVDRADGWIGLAVGGSETHWHLVELPPPPGWELDIDPVRLAQHVLHPLFGIDESVGDPRLVHQPGPGDLDAVTGLQLGPGQVAFLMRPVPGDVLLHVADRGGTMPPKSTYFVPKVRSGLFVRLTDPTLSGEAGVTP
ncbi:MAG: DUF1015 family protein [Actinomycetota bacterium]